MVVSKPWKSLPHNVAVNLAPPARRATLEFLARFLSKVAAHEDANRMGSQGLALVLSPNLLRNPGENALVFQVKKLSGTSSCASFLSAYIRLVAS